MLRIWLTMLVGAVLVVSSGVVASLARAQSSGDPAAVITAYEMARNRHDLEAALAYFADDATISQRSATFAGKDEIRKFLDGVSSRSRFVVVSDRRVNGTRITWTERSGGSGPVVQTQMSQPQGLGPNALASGATPSSFVVTVEAVVQDGKIRSLVYMAVSSPARVDTAIDGRQLPAFVGVLLIASISLRRSTSASTLQGRLMQDLQGWSAARQ
jgi:hypothetical protein